MVSEDSVRVWQAIHNKLASAAMRIPDAEQREDALQDAWVAIEQSEPNRSDDYYYQVGLRAMESNWRKWRRRNQPNRARNGRSTLVSVRLSHDGALSLSMLCQRRDWDRSHALRMAIEAGLTELLDTCT